MFFLPPEYIFLFNIKTSYIIICVYYKNAKKLICKHFLRKMNHIKNKNGKKYNKAYNK